MAESDRSCDLQDDDSIVKELECHMQLEEANETEAFSFAAIAQKLVKHNLILTALELHAELQEAGKELPWLKDYFSNPSNFEKLRAPEKSSSPSLSLHRSGSCETFDSIDWARYSDDGNRQADEKLAALEFELRKAQDTIRSLRAALTQATEHNFANQATDNNLDRSARSTGAHSTERAVVKVHEKRALNFLVNEYLLAHDYKLSSVTFAEENSSQNFEVWEDVGLNIAKPPDLLTLYRDYTQHVIPAKMVCDVSCQCDSLYAEQVQTLQDDNQHLVASLADKDETLSRCHATLGMQAEELLLLRQAVADLTLRLSEMQRAADAASVAAIHGGDSPPKSEYSDRSTTCSSCNQPFGNHAAGTSNSGHRVFDYEPCGRNVSRVFRSSMLALAVDISNKNRIAAEISKVTHQSLSAVVSVVSRSIPYILPNVLLAKREELIPIILCAATLNDEPEECDKLLSCLFNLIKKPDAEQRQMILAGCVMFAQMNGPVRVEAELLPQCWGQINDKHEERRLLVAEACSALIPYLPGVIRGSLVLSMLQQMLKEEKVSFVRAAITKSLGVLTTFIDAADKYPQIQDLLFRVMMDSEEDVQLAGLHVFLPAVALWASELGILETNLTAALLSRLDQCISPPSETGDISVDVKKLRIILNYLAKLVPFWFTSVVKSNPYLHGTQATPSANVIVTTAQHLARWRVTESQSLVSFTALDDDEHRLAHAIEVFDSCINEEWYKTWDQFDFFCKDMIPKIIQILLVVDLSYAEAVTELAAFLTVLSSIFGPVFTDTKIKPKFVDILQFSERTPMPHQLQKVLTRSSIVPAYVCGILVCRAANEADVQQLTSFLQQMLTVVALNKLPRDSLVMVFNLLCISPANHALVLRVLQDCISHKSFVVRAGATKLFELVVKHVNSDVIEDKVLPILTTLSQDADLVVRTATAGVYGAILERSKSSQVLEKVYVDFQKLLDDPVNREQHVVLMEIISTFTKMVPKAEPKFRDDVILPRLAVIAATNSHNSGGAVKRLEVALRLLEAYSALSCCFVSPQLVNEAFLPGLRCLLQDMKDLSPGHVDSIVTMMRDLESKIATEATAHDGGLGAASTVGAASLSQPRHGRYNVISKLKDLKDKPSHGLFSKKK